MTIRIDSTDDDRPIHAAISVPKATTYACPDCGGTGDDRTIADIPCRRCRGNGTLTTEDMTPIEIETAIRLQDDDDRTRNDFDTHWE